MSVLYRCLRRCPACTVRSGHRSGHCRQRGRLFRCTNQVVDGLDGDEGNEGNEGDEGDEGNEGDDGDEGGAARSFVVSSSASSGVV